jgi:hypothetical protein
MKSSTRIFAALKGCIALLLTAVGVLFSTDDDESDDRPLGEGSDRFGEHNFRTGLMDSGTDPDGWYEEDL